ncbi:ankyrin repeat domain-containing protein [Acidobacteriota bacterium]
MTKSLFGLIVAFFLFSAFIHAEEENIIDAAKDGDAIVVKSLLQKNPELINTIDGGIGATALHWACIYGKKEVAAVILTYKPDVNREEAHAGTSMHWAAHFDDAEVIDWLLDLGAEIDHVNNYGRTPFLVAARRGCTMVINTLFKRGANINQKLRDGSTALHIAAQNGHINAVELLLSIGVDRNAKNSQGRTYTDVFFSRPEIISVDPDIFNSYAGIYERENGGFLDIRRENNRLYYYAYGKDELLPISKTHFIRHAELGYFTFIKEKNGDVNEVIYKTGTTESRANKIK